MNISELAEKKRLLRQRVRTLLKAIPPASIPQASARLCSNLRRLPIWTQSSRVLFYHPLPGEPDLRPLLEEALQTGKSVGLPRFESASGCYSARQVASIASLRPGHFGILEPPPEALSFDLKLLDLSLVPGLAYDYEGRRLGRGRGYMDRLLAAAAGHLCGVAWDEQIVPEVAAGPDDIRVDSLLTPSGWFRCAGRPADL